jgi:hypothetical protein
MNVARYHAASLRRKFDAARAGLNENMIGYPKFWQNEPNLIKQKQGESVFAAVRDPRAGIEFIDENGGGPVVRLRKRTAKKPSK